MCLGTSGTNSPTSKQRDLHEAPLTTLLAKFHGYDKAKDPLVVLFAAVETIFDKLTDTLANQKVIRLLRQSSSEKSVEPSSHR